MFSLTGFELRKLWGRRSFLLSICTILLVNIFFLWYANLPEAGEPGLSAYAKLGQELSGVEYLMLMKYCVIRRFLIRSWERTWQTVRKRRSLVFLKNTMTCIREGIISAIQTPWRRNRIL